MSAPKPLPSLRSELTRLATWIGLGWLLVLSVTLTWAVKHEVDDLMDETLRESAEVMYGVLVAAQLPGAPGGALPAVLPAPEHDEHMVWQIADDRGQVLRRSHRAPATALSAQPLGGFFDAPGQWRAYGLRLPQGGMLYVAQVGSERVESRYEAVASVVAVATLVSLVWVLLLRRRTQQALRPLEQLAREIEAYDPQRPASAPRPGERAETAAITEALASLGQRLARRLELEQAFAACAAHSLRTPLAGMDAQLALAQREPSEMLPQRISRVRGAVARLTQVVQSLLALFRTGDELSLALRDCRLEELLEQIPLDGLSVEVSQDCEFRADPNLLTIALLNLLDNTQRFGARQVKLQAQALAQGVALRLEDDGRGATDTRRREIQQALREGDLGPGLGLGLRLASMVARAHRGELRVPPQQAGQAGFSVELRLWTREVD
ncbi:MAG: HAMP domain-containing histidine kinase [Roseateles sp.]|nr:MAG: HAMP domain-containing histidine kinase [Roseateles sp.]